MIYRRLLTFKLIAGVLSGVYIFDFRKAWAAEELPVAPAIQVEVER